MANLGTQPERKMDVGLLAKAIRFELKQAQEALDAISKWVSYMERVGGQTDAGARTGTN